MHTAQEIQVERKDIQYYPNQPLLYQSLQFGFTPSFFGHGWECSLSPIHEFPNTHLETPGNILISFEKIKRLALAFNRVFHIKIFPSVSTIIRLFL